MPEVQVIERAYLKIWVANDVPNRREDVSS